MWSQTECRRGGSKIPQTSSPEKRDRQTDGLAGRKSSAQQARAPPFQETLSVSAFRAPTPPYDLGGVHPTPQSSSPSPTVVRVLGITHQNPADSSAPSFFFSFVPHSISEAGEVRVSTPGATGSR